MLHVRRHGSSAQERHWPNVGLMLSSSVKISYLNFHPHEVVLRYRNQQLHYSNKITYMFLIRVETFANLDV